MALLSQKNVGGTTVTPTTATLSETDVRTTFIYTTPTLATPSLPKIQFFARFYGGGGVPTPTTSGAVQFNVATRTLNGEPDFFLFRYVFLPPNVGATYEFEFPCIAVRALLIAPQVGTEVRVDYSLNAFGP
jgi:hypothetical protein